MSNWYPRYFGDYMRDTGHLTLVEHGAYTVMLDHYYAAKSGLPEGDAAIYRLCRAFTDQERAAVDSVCRQFFPVNGNGRHRNHRADKEIDKEIAISKSRSKAGSKRWEDRNKSIALDKQVLSNPDANDTTSTSTSTDTGTAKTIIERESRAREEERTLETARDQISAIMECRPEFKRLSEAHILAELRAAPPEGLHSHLNEFIRDAANSAEVKNPIGMLRAYLQRIGPKPSSGDRPKRRHEGYVSGLPQG